MGPKSNMTGIFIRRGGFDTETHREEDHVMMEVEIGVMMLQAKEY